MSERYIIQCVALIGPGTFVAQFDGRKSAQRAYKKIMAVFSNAKKDQIILPIEFTDDMGIERCFNAGNYLFEMARHQDFGESHQRNEDELSSAKEEDTVAPYQLQ
jgi:hypothetical protein